MASRHSPPGHPRFTPGLLLAALCAALAFHLGALPVRAFETTWWVWHRSAPLSDDESQILASEGVRKLYWHAGTLRSEGEGWHLEGRLNLPEKGSAAIALAPVLRLSADGALPLGAAAAESVSQILMEAARRAEAGEVQIDFDCSDRRLSDYAGFLAKCRARIAPIRLSATALAGWSKAQAFEKLQAGVDSLMPMFYDLVPDAPSEVRAGRALPLVDAASLANQIESWRTCRIPWFAGVPNFARITVFDREGRSRGHLREWDWDSICFNPVLALRAQPAPGVTLLQAGSDAVLVNTPVSKGETIACRRPDLVQLAQTLAVAEKAGATGAAIFRLPGAGSQGGWSLRQMDTLLRERTACAPEFKLRRTPHGLEMINISVSDLAPRLAGKSGDHDRGWQLEVESSAGAVFREASPGEFANVFGHAEPDAAEPRRVQIPMAQRLTYWFADLRAGQSRQTGLLQLAPGVEAASLRWRIPHSSENSQWQPIE